MLKSGWLFGGALVFITSLAAFQMPWRVCTSMEPYDDIPLPPDYQAKTDFVFADLSLHGVTKPVSLAVKKAGNSYTAHTALKQTTFGIKPISIGGLIKGKQEVELAFAIFPK